MFATLKERCDFVTAREAGRRAIRRLSSRQIAKEINSGLCADGGPLPLSGGDERRQVSQPTVSAVLRGEVKNPRLRVLELLEDYFGCPPGYLRNRRSDGEGPPAAEAHTSHLEVVAARLPYLSVEQLEILTQQATELIARHREGELPPNRLQRRGRGGQT